MTRELPSDWYGGTIPTNVRLADSVFLETTFSFALCRSMLEPAVEILEGASVCNNTLFDLGQSAQVTVGRYTLLNGPRIICDEHVEVGDYVLMSWGVLIMDTYRFSADPRIRRKELRALVSTRSRIPKSNCRAQPVQIRSNVWIGFDSCIMPGVTVGEGSIVGARSVVTRDVPPYTIVGGNPAVVIKELSAGDVCANS